MKRLLEYAPHHLVRDDRQEHPILHNLLPSFFDDHNVPIEPRKSEWTHVDNPQRLIRLFEFESYNDLRYFLDSLLDYQERTQHHAKLIIDESTIRVETHTHSLNAVSELDIALSKFCDEVYEDLNYLARMRKEKQYVADE